MLCFKIVINDTALGGNNMYTAILVHIHTSTLGSIVIEFLQFAFHYINSEWPLTLAID